MAETSSPKTVCLTLTPECDRVIREVACSTGRSYSETVEDLLWAHVETRTAAFLHSVTRKPRARGGRPKRGYGSDREVK